MTAGALIAMFAAGGLAGWRLNKLYRDYFGPPPGQHFTCVCLEGLVEERLSHYYVQARGKNADAVEAGLFTRPPLDAHGVPLVDYGPPAGRQYNPCVVADFGLEYWELWLAGRPDARNAFLCQAKWLVANQDRGNWYYRFDWDLPTHGMRSPWISAISQGKAVSLLLRAWQDTGDSSFAEAAHAGLQPFGIPIDRGGLACRVEGGTWFEEYPNPSRPGHVLNGHMWALFGLWDAVRATNHPMARQWFDEGARALEANLPRYDTGYWVLYELLPGRPLVNSSYMHFQVDQLRVLAAITGTASLAAAADRWESYHRSLRSFLGLALGGVGRRARRMFHPTGVVCEPTA